MRFDPKIGYGKYVINCIPCDFPPCNSMINQPWDTGMLEHQQQRYQKVIFFTYWPMLGSFNN